MQDRSSGACDRDRLVSGFWKVKDHIQAIERLGRDLQETVRPEPGGRY
ncbi:hypothetical protein [Endozoicomonas sp. ONNA1]|nr:hypothetical protein [Endozoicomonas sp. ONNA1]